MDNYSLYKYIIITKKGYEFYSRIIAGEKLRFTKIKLGSGELTENIDLEELTDVINFEMYCEIVAVTQENTQATIHINLTSDNIVTPFKFREIGIYAEIDGEEILYAYLHTGDKFDYLVPSSNGQVFSDRLQIAISVGKAENVEVIFDNTIIVNNSINIDMLDESVKEYIANYVDNAISHIKPSAPSTNNKFEIVKDGDNYIANINGDLEQNEDDFVLNL